MQPIFKHNEKVTTDIHENEDQSQEIRTINLFRIKTARRKVKSHTNSKVPEKEKFRIQIVIKNHLEKLITDTGATISV